MIPLRVYVKGFLSYRDEAELMFDGAPLWALTGPNGSGKSAIFDAITFALYGAHRGGKSQAEELINHEADELVVEYDFAIGSDAYRVKRTLSRGRRPSFQVFHLNGPRAPHPGQPGPQPIPNTDKRDGFNEWVLEHIGLDYHTFTASVLLRQGESEALLKADPKDRHEMLAQIVNLAAYERLYQKADERRRDFENQAGNFQSQLQGYDPIDETEIEELASRANRAREEREAAQSQLEHLIEIKVQAKRWNELNDALKAEQEKLKRALDAAGSALREIGSDVLQHPGLATLSTAITQSSIVSESLLETLDQQIAHTEEELQRTSELKTSLPLLRLFARARREWHEAEAEARKAQDSVSEIAKQFASIVDEKRKAAELKSDAAEQVKQTHTKLIEAQTLLEQQQDRLERFAQVDGKPACSYCGQELTPEHLQVERARLEQEEARARSNHERAERDYRQALEAQETADRALRKLDDTERELRVKQQNAEQQLRQAQRDQAKAVEQAREAWTALPHRYRAQIAPSQIFDITACFSTEFPTDSQLSDFSRQAGQHELQQKRLGRLRTLSAALSEQRACESRRRQIEQEIDAIPQPARRRWTEIEADENAIRQGLRELDKIRTEAERRQHELEVRRKQRCELEKNRRKAAHQAQLYKELARLLGRDYLQRHLLKQAESAIVRHANQVLDHISGGMLRLGLRESKVDAEGGITARSGVKALDLIAYNRQSSSAPLPVAFLSGSQRFRVAISLALGIGQYAGHASRRIESVIIDEGFGSLDKQGRSEMVAELHALKNALRRIILVSHQEEFADAFPNRYVIELSDGTSRVNLLESM